MSESQPDSETTERLHGAYDVTSPEEARDYYDGWAEDYDAELAENAYATPDRVAEALGHFAEGRAAPVADFGCGTGLGGAALTAAGFTTIDGYDIAPAMLRQAGEKGVYRYLSEADLSGPLDIADGAYAHAVAVGALNPNLMPATVIDEILRVVAP
ncbi:MAG: methyltransferase domain-containing protein, partial [Pseudomonadota bacterium]